MQFDGVLRITVFIKFVLLQGLIEALRAVEVIHPQSVQKMLLQKGRFLLLQAVGLYQGQGILITREKYLQLILPHRILLQLSDQLPYILISQQTLHLSVQQSPQ